MAFLRGTERGESLTGTSKDDEIWGMGGDDTVRGLGGHDVLHGGDGSGEFGDDTLFGGDGDDRIEGGNGDDGLYGEIGNDFLETWDFGDDYAEGGKGNDTVRAGAGNDRLYGGTQILDDGIDTLELFVPVEVPSGRPLSVLVGLGDGVLATFSGEPPDLALEDVSTISGFENIVSLGGSRDTIRGSDVANRIESGGGDDAIEALGGNDTVLGGTGNDIMIGGAGRDVLSGGKGRDVYHYQAAADSPAAAYDRITGFEGVGQAAGDRVLLSEVSPGTLRFVGTGPFTGVDQVRVVDQKNGDTAVFVNLSGSTAPEMGIAVADGAVKALTWTADEFVL